MSAAARAGAAAAALGCAALAAARCDVAARGDAEISKFVAKAPRAPPVSGAARAPRSPAVTEALAALGPHGVAIIWGTFSAVILAALAQAFLGQRRADRSAAVIVAAEKLLLAHAGLRARAGPVFAGGAYSVAVDAVAARGSFDARTAAGARVKVYVTAARAGAAVPWVFSDVRVELDCGDIVDVVAADAAAPLQ
jgi:hypothetical protein